MPTTRNSALAALQYDPVIGSRAEGLAASAFPAKVVTTYTMLGTEAAGDFVRICKLPPRARVDPTLSSITSEGVATTLTIDVGDDDDEGVGAQADADRYADGLDCAAAGVDLFSAIAASARLTPYVTSKECWLIAELKTLATPVAGKKLTFRVVYDVVA
jgi:hypothetical protein